MFKSQLYTTKRNQVKADCWWLLECGWWVSGSIAGVLHCCSVCTNYSTWLPTPASAQTHYGETKYYPVPRHYLTSYRVTAYSDTVKGGPISYYRVFAGNLQKRNWKIDTSLGAIGTQNLFSSLYKLGVNFLWNGRNCCLSHFMCQGLLKVMESSAHFSQSLVISSSI